MSELLRVYWNEDARQQLLQLKKQHASFANLKGAMKLLRSGKRPKASRYHDHELTRALAGWRSVAIGIAPWLPADQQRIVMVYRIFEGAIDVAFIDLHDKAYISAKTAV